MCGDAVLVLNEGCGIIRIVSSPYTPNVQVMQASQGLVSNFYY